MKTTELKGHPTHTTRVGPVNMNPQVTAKMATYLGHPHRQSGKRHACPMPGATQPDAAPPPSMPCPRPLWGQVGAGVCLEMNEYCTYTSFAIKNNNKFLDKISLA